MGEATRYPVHPDHAECMECGAYVDSRARCVDDGGHDSGWLCCETCAGDGCGVCRGHGIRPSRRLRDLALATAGGFSALSDPSGRGVFCRHAPDYDTQEQGDE